MDSQDQHGHESLNKNLQPSDTGIEPWPSCLLPSALPLELPCVVAYLLSSHFNKSDCCLPGRACDAAAHNRFRPKSRVPNLVGDLPLVSYVCLVGQSLKGKMMRVMMESGGGHRGQCNRFPGICLTSEENSGKPQLGNRRGHLVAAQSLLQMRFLSSK